MYKFAHLADCHLGAFRDSVLRNLNLDAFNWAMDKCIEERVDFIVISGDLFDNNLPDTAVLNSAVRKMKQVRDNGIEIYAIYGSHDYSISKTSMIDVLNSAGLFTKVGNVREIDNKRTLEFVVDKKTGAKISGLSAQKKGMEKNLYESLDMSNLENEGGFKIFMFHSTIEELKPNSLSFLEAIPLSYLPKNFAYYAGGHVHLKRVEKKNGTIAYPGPLFGYDYRDLENSAKGEKRGFFIVEFNHSVSSHRFVEIEHPEIILLEYDANDKPASKASEEMEDMIKKVDFQNKIVLFKVEGELSAGKPSDIDFSRLKNYILENNALTVYMSRNNLTAKDREEIKVVGETKEEIESRIFEESIKKIKIENEKLRGENGVNLSLNLLSAMKEENLGGKKTDYDKKMVEKGMKVLGL